MAGVYVHIPFCKQACYYCDFHFSTNQDKRGEMVAAIVQEVRLQRHYLSGEIVETIYFGGGTPSLLTPEEISSVTQAIRTTMQVSPDVEVTLEANPDDLSYQKLSELFKAGINRLSIGIQSFDNSVLQYLNRAHDAASSFQCIEDARKAGFTNLSIDLIYAIPMQDDEAWTKNIAYVLDLKPEHVSAYSLTIEEKTTFGRWAAQGKLKIASEENAAVQLELLVKKMELAGYEQYEVSNFCRPGFISKHNSSYWKQKKYLGVGPSAHSYNGYSRQHNINNNHLYLQSMALGKIPSTVEVLSREDQINDYLLTTLRTSWGTDFQKLREQLDYDIMEIHGKYIEELVAQDLAYFENDTFILTRKGKMLADKISSDLFATS
jgi:oxygen-independent coproporphyrinogen III oxidase